MIRGFFLKNLITENVDCVSLTTYLDKLTASCLNLFHQFSICKMFRQEMVQTCNRPTTQSLLTKQMVAKLRMWFRQIHHEKMKCAC